MGDNVLENDLGIQEAGVAGLLRDQILGKGRAEAVSRDPLKTDPLLQRKVITPERSELARRTGEAEILHRTAACDPPVRRLQMWGLPCSREEATGRI